MAKKTISERPIRFVSFATAWGSRHGGINSFNRDFCSALAELLDSGIACVVPAASNEEVSDALAEGVFLHSLGPHPRDEFEMESATRVSMLPTLKDVEYWIGHDIITGEFAAKVKEIAGRGLLAAIMHQSYQDYAIKPSVADLSGKAQRQRALFANADKVFAVGPLLHELSIDWSPKANVINPGLRVVNHRPAENALRVAVIGRLTEDNTLLKGIELAGHAVAEAVKRAFAAKGKSIAQHTLLKFIGTEPNDAYTTKLKKAMEKRAGRPLNINFIPFLPVPELLKEIEGVNLSLMLSWHEGFGLVGWEAIGAGIPLILGQDTGVFKLLEDLGGRATGCVKSVEVSGSSEIIEPFQESDLENASTAVLRTIGDIRGAIRDAAELRTFLLDRGFTWKAAARNFIDALSPKIMKDAISNTATSEGFPVMEMVSAAGLTAFYPSREYYRAYRTASSIDTYVLTAQHSVVMVSVNLMTGIPFDGLCEALNSKLEHTLDFSATISLLNPMHSWLMQSLAPVLDQDPEWLAKSICDSLKRLWELKQRLSDKARERFSLRVHGAIPFGSAILIDHSTSEGRVQIETKAYKVGLRKSFAFEIGPSGSSGLYQTLVSGYLNLIEEGKEVDAEFLVKAYPNIEKRQKETTNATDQRGSADVQAK